MASYLNSLSKRVLDIIFSILVLPIALPLMAIGALLIFLSDGGFFLFTQERIGKGGLPFSMIKIRTLRKGFQAEQSKQHSDADILKVGRLLRQFRIDELPQIWNILVGEMSWVGPRPEIKYYFEHYCGIEPNFYKRQSCKPGITGLAQLKDPDATPDHSLEKLPHDLEYIKKASFWMDIRILVQSLFSVLK
jgi:lipopolysaccharide/colanic/teichoic acid biosynthesis glycosyltransferase